MRYNPLQPVSYGIAVLNMISAFIYGIAISDKLHLEGKVRIFVQVVVLIFFVVLEFIPKIVLLPAGAAGFMNVRIIWALLSRIGTPSIRILLKIFAIAIVALFEISLFGDVTVLSREDKSVPTRGQLKAQGYKKHIKNGVTFYTKD